MKRVAVSQMAGIVGDNAATMAQVIADIETAAARDADLLIFPEAIMTGYYRSDLKAEHIPPVDDWLVELQERAKNSHLALIIGTLRAVDNGMRNSAIAINENGIVVARYNKRALYSAWEQNNFIAGTDFDIVELAGIRTGLLICYDIEFPEFSRELARGGAQLIATPTALMAPGDQIAQVLVPARAIENQVFVAYANRVGVEENLVYIGQSSIVGPDGAMLARAGNEPALIFADLDFSRTDMVRAENSYLDDMPMIDRYFDGKTHG